MDFNLQPDHRHFAAPGAPAAILGQVTDQPRHRGVVWRIDQRATIAALRDQSRLLELGKVEAERGSRQIKRLGNGPRSQACMSGLHQQTIRGKPMMLRPRAQYADNFAPRTAIPLFQ